MLQFQQLVAALEIQVHHNSFPYSPRSSTSNSTRALISNGSVLVMIFNSRFKTFKELRPPSSVDIIPVRELFAINMNEQIDVRKLSSKQ